MEKFINLLKSKQNLILGLLVALFLVLIFLQTLSITAIHTDESVKDFSIMRPVSVPTQGDVKVVLRIFEDEIADFSFDHLYNNVYTLFTFGIVAIAFCFKKFNRGLISKLYCLAYGVYALYSLLFTNNLAYTLATYDSTYIAKIVVAALIALFALVSVLFIIIDLSKNGWLKEVNVHIFLNSFCTALMIAGLALMFIPFEFEGETASIMGFMLLPSNYASGFGSEFRKLLGDITLNSAVIIPILLFVIGVLGSIFGAGYHKNIVVPVMSIVWALLLAAGCFINPLISLDGKFIIYLVIAVALIAVAVLNIIQHHKANAIYR